MNAAGVVLMLDLDMKSYPKSLLPRVSVIALAASFAASSASANTIILAASTTLTNGRPVNVDAIFSTGQDTIAIKLDNNLWNPIDVTQLLSDLWFTVSNMPNPFGTITSSSGKEVTVTSKAVGGFSASAATVDAGWGLTTYAGGLHLNVLGTQIGPSHLIIGPSNNGTYDAGGAYTAANGSIKGNHPHNPFLESGVTFNLSVPGVTAASTITNAEFSFGTSQPQVYKVRCDTCGGTGAGYATPEPVSLLLIGGGLITFGFLRRRA